MLYNIVAECVPFITLIEKYLFCKCHEMFITKARKVFDVAGSESSNAIHIPYFSIDKAQLMYNAHPKHFRHPF
jgi:hypothetical protein